ncbi:MAG TPA: amino acid adenylation domain-containing protein [Terriglobales bacterium]|nr:amino acid adenylation domain-containing protein [Terriglobales bacterium]
MQEPVGFQLSSQQKRIWHLQGYGQPLAAQIALALEGELDTARLRGALGKVVERHEILRTSFVRPAGMKFALQVVNAEARSKWEQLDLRKVAPADLEAHLRPVLAAAKLDLGAATGMVHGLLAMLPANRNILVLTLAALCADGASLNKLAGELAKYYGEAEPEAGDPLQYADYSEWQNELEQREDQAGNAGREYWAGYKTAQIPALSLPFARRRQAEEFAPEVVPVALDQGVQTFLASAVNAADFLLACWQVFLWRLTGQREVVVGYVSDGRSHEELNSAQGAFARILPAYANFGTEVSVAEAARHSAKVRAAAVEHQDYFQLEDPDSLPAGFSVAHKPAKQSSGGITFTVFEQRCRVHGFALELRCLTGDAAWQAELVFDPASLPREFVEVLSRRLGALLAGAAADPSGTVSSLPVMDAKERQQVVTGFNQTAADYPRGKCIQELFEQQAARYPNRPALRAGEQEFSYAQLNSRANQLAHFLRKNGVAANTAVGLCVERSADMILGLLGILKAGGCYLPLAAENPQARLAHQLSETAAPLVVTQQKLLERLPDFAGKVICLDRDLGEFEHEPRVNPRLVNTAEDLVYVIYTSGSTGIPKGVAVRHRNLVNYSHFIRRRLQLEQAAQGVHCATVSTISADLGNTCIFPALIAGACLHVIPYEMAMAANLFTAYTAKHPIDVLKITPSHLNTLLNAPEGKAVLPSKYLVLGGEALSWHLVDRIREAGKCAVVNHYGPTEATVGCSTFTVSENEVKRWNPATVPIGRPIANDEIYILNPNLEPCPVGVAGELAIGGAGLAREYLNQPQQTAERFVAHPFSKDPGDRLYRTGDLARFLPDGNIEFLGRIDHQVKIRGFRVEPAEIEAALRVHPLVRQTVIVPYDDAAGEKRLAAYIVSPQPLAPEELRRFLLERLPDYMVPSAFMRVASVPLTANGKVDFRALPSPEQPEAPAERESIAPRNPEEEKLVGIWREVLRTERIGVSDNFFDLGGHSLLATQIISRIRATFRVQMPLHSFLQTPTVAELARKIVDCPRAESEEEEMARLLEELEGVSDEEAERLLADKGGADLEGGSAGRER